MLWWKNTGVEQHVRRQGQKFMWKKKPLFFYINCNQSFFYSFFQLLVLVFQPVFGSLSTLVVLSFTAAGSFFPVKQALRFTVHSKQQTVRGRNQLLNTMGSQSVSDTQSVDCKSRISRDGPYLLFHLGDNLCSAVCGQCETKKTIVSSLTYQWRWVTSWPWCKLS